MRLDDDLHQRIARLALAWAGRALAAQAQDLAVLNAGRDRHLQGSAARQSDGLGRAVHGVEEIDLKFIVQIRARGPPRLLGAAPQEFGDEIVGICAKSAKPVVL